MIVRHRTAPTAFDANLNRAFDQLTTSFFDNRRPTGPVLDGAWSDDEYVLTVDLPGVPASAVSVDVTGTTLTIAVDTDELTWKRSLRLGGRLDPDKVGARHVDGRLTVIVGSYDAPEPRSIEISTAAPAIEAADTDAIEADSTDATEADSTDES